VGQMDFILEYSNIILQKKKIMQSKDLKLKQIDEEYEKLKKNYNMQLQDKK